MFGLNRGFLFSRYRLFCYVTLIRFSQFSKFNFISRFFNYLGTNSLNSLIFTSLLHSAFLVATATLHGGGRVVSASGSETSISNSIRISAIIYDAYTSVILRGIYLSLLFEKEYYSITGNHISVRICFICLVLFQHCCVCFVILISWNLVFYFRNRSTRSKLSTLYAFYALRCRGVLLTLDPTKITSAFRNWKPALL